MISLITRFIYDIMISFYMKTQSMIETKKADWIAAFNSISNKQSEEAQILNGLISGLKNKTVGEGIVIAPEVA